MAFLSLESKLRTQNASKHLNILPFNKRNIWIFFCDYSHHLVKTLVICHLELGHLMSKITFSQGIEQLQTAAEKSAKENDKSYDVMCLNKLKVS